MVPVPTGPAGDDARRAGAAVRERLEALGQVSAELLHDLSDAAYAVEQRALLALGEARMGRTPVAEMERAAEAGAEMRAMLRDVMDVLRGAPVSPEVRFDPRETLERAVRRFVPRSGPVDVRLVCDLPPGAAMAGRESFLARLAANLLAGAARRARSRVLLEARMEERGPGGPVLVLSVEDDGAARGASGDPAPHPRPSPEDGWRPAVVAWLVTQLDGHVGARRGGSLGGSGLEVRIPAHHP